MSRAELKDLNLAELETYWSVYVSTYKPETQTEKYEKHRKLQEQLPKSYKSKPVYGKVTLPKPKVKHGRR